MTYQEETFQNQGSECKKRNLHSDSFTILPVHIWIYCLDKWNMSPAGSLLQINLSLCSRSNYLDLHLEIGKGKRFFFYASLGYRISNTIQMSLKGLMIQLKIAAICSNWKCDHHFLWSLELGMSKYCSWTVSKEATGERWNHPEVAVSSLSNSSSQCCTFLEAAHVGLHCAIPVLLGVTPLSWRLCVFGAC